MTVCLERCGALGVELPLGAGGRPKELQVLLRKLVKGEGAEVISQRRLEGMAESVAWENLTVGTYEVLLGCLVGRDQSKRISSAPRLQVTDAKGTPVRHRYEPENPDGYSSYGYNTKAAGAILAIKGRGVGDLKLRFAEIKGYLPIEDQSVRIKQGEIGALKIELRSVWDD